MGSEGPRNGKGIEVQTLGCFLPPLGATCHSSWSRLQLKGTKSSLKQGAWPRPGIPSLLVLPFADPSSPQLERKPRTATSLPTSLSTVLPNCYPRESASEVSCLTDAWGCRSSITNVQESQVPRWGLAQASPSTGRLAPQQVTLRGWGALGDE